MNEAKVAILYHAHCVDGFTAAWIAHNALAVEGLDIDMVPVSYGKPMPISPEKYSHIYIVDFSYPAEILLCMAALVGISVVVLDHHETAQRNLSCLPHHPKLEVIFDMNRSGAMITWDYFHPHSPAPTLIHHVQDHDLWRFLIPGTKEVIAALKLKEQSIGMWNSLHVEDLKREGEAILGAYWSYINNIISCNKRSITINGITGLVCNAPAVFASDIGNLLAKESGTFGATYDQQSDGRTKFSLRSIGDFNVATIAEIFGGGGHKNAAGFHLSNPGETDAAGITIWNEN